MFGFKKKIEWPTSAWLLQRQMDQSFTPDYAKLEMHETQLLFVYGREMTNHPLNSLLEGHSIPIGTAYTKSGFTMWKKELGKETSPVVLGGKTFQRLACPIRGELYAVRPYQFKRVLDLHHRNGVVFERQRVSLHIPYRDVVWTKQHGTLMTDEQIQKVRAWMYIGVPSYWEDQIDDGYLGFKPVRKFETHGLNHYYHFTQMEYYNVEDSSS